MRRALGEATLSAVLGGVARLIGPGRRSDRMAPRPHTADRQKSEDVGRSLMQTGICARKEVRRTLFRAERRQASPAFSGMCGQPA